MNKLTYIALCIISASWLFANDIEVHGSISQSYIHSLYNDFIYQGTRDGSLEYSEAYINFSQQFNSDLRFGIQFGFRNMGENESFEPYLNWAYGDYKPLQYLGIKVGKIKTPFGIFNESRDIDFARANVLLDQGIYPESFRVILTSYNGLGFYGSFSFNASPVQSISYNIYGGTANIPDYYSSIQSTQQYYNSPQSSIKGVIVAGSYTSASIGENITAAHSYLYTKGSLDLQSEMIGKNFPLPLQQNPFLAPLPYTKHAFNFNLNANLFSLEAQIHSFTITTEYEYWLLTSSASEALINNLTDVSLPFLENDRAQAEFVAREILPKDDVVKHAWYINVLYQITDDFGVHFNAGLVNQHNDNTGNTDQNFRNAEQKHIGTGAHFYVLDNFLLKSEYHYFLGDFSSYPPTLQAPHSDGHLFITRASFSF